MKIINETIPYSFSILKQNLSSLSSNYPFLQVHSIGKSVLSKDIYLIKIGKGKKKVFYSASYHANEWITSLLLMKFLEEFCIAYQNNQTIYGISAKDIFNRVTIYLVPMVNPDGVTLLTDPSFKNTSAYQKCFSISQAYPDIPFPYGWKANINGVDLNLQFPAGWETAKKIKYKQGFTKPAPRDFVGASPLTEPESLAIYNFTCSHNFRLVIAYHTQGQEIYWNFQDICPFEGYDIGLKFAQISGYHLANVPYNSSFAGFKDWFLLNYNKPGFTIEAGIGKSPLPLSQFDQIYQDNIGILLLATII